MTAGTQATRPPTRRLAWIASIVLALAGVGAGAAFLWWWLHPPVPPEIPVENLEAPLAQALTEARAAVLAEPRSGETWGTLGRTLLANELYPEISGECFTHAEQYEPDNPRWPYFAAIALVNRGRRLDALPKLERAVNLEAASERPQAAPRLALAETLIAVERPEAAAAHFQEVFARDPKNARARFGLATLTISRQEWNAAREHLEACLGTPQARKKACAQLAMVWRRLGDPKNADHYANLEARMPKDSDWPDPFILEHSHLSKRKKHRFSAVDQLESAGHPERAVAILQEMVQDYPDDDLVHLMLGRVVAQLGDYAGAGVHLKKAIDLSPDKHQPYYLLGLAELRRGEALLAAGEARRGDAIAAFKKSEEAARHVLSVRPDYGYAHMALGLALKNLGKKPESLAALRQAVHCNPEYAENHYFLGMALVEEGKLDEARPYFEQALLLADPRDVRPRTALDKYYPSPKQPLNP